MVNFITKNPNLGTFLRALQWKTFDLLYVKLVHFMVIWYILWSFGIFYDHLVYFMAIWYILWLFGIFCGHLVHFSLFWHAVPRKIWQP
jgi:hypothetical protein